MELITSADDERFSEDLRVLSMLQALGGTHAADHPLFIGGYTEMCRCGRDNARILEICSGSGDLASALSRACPNSRIIALDRYIPSDKIGETGEQLQFLAGDAFDLSAHEAESFDLVFGQAALHHLAHDLDRLREEVLRVLKPGGKLIFVFEPMGHNLLVAAIRAIRMARHEYGDESNLYLSQLQILGRGFHRCEVQVFNFFGYFLKGFPKSLQWITRLAHRLDHFLFRHSSRCRGWAANANIIFTK
jgi:ubiquinone/menaquinone biosynthesis C-methylase UbiE